MKSNKYTREKHQKQADTKQKKSCSIKDRPKNVDELVSAIERGQLDNRTNAAKKIVAMRAAIAENPAEVAKGLARDVLAVNSVITASIVKEIAGPGFSVLDEQGQLHPLIARHWPQTQKDILTAAQTLLRFEQAAGDTKPLGKPAAPKSGECDSEKVLDVSSLVLALNNASNEENSHD